MTWSWGLPLQNNFVIRVLGKFLYSSILTWIAPLWRLCNANNRINRDVGNAWFICTRYRLTGKNAISCGWDVFLHRCRKWVWRFKIIWRWLMGIFTCICAGTLCRGGKYYLHKFTRGDRIQYYCSRWMHQDLCCDVSLVWKSAYKIQYLNTGTSSWTSSHGTRYFPFSLP